MIITCIDCKANGKTTTFEVEGDGLFAPRLCEPCRLARLTQAENVLTKDRTASANSHRRATLEVVASKVPSPSDTSRFRPEVWNEIKAWRWRADKQPVMLVFGPTGKGKTRMVVQTCIEQIADTPGMTIDWWTGLELKAAVLATYAKGVNAHTLEGLRNQLARASWLVFDDWLSHAKSTASHGEFLLSVLDERIARNRPTLITMQGTPTGERKAVIWAIEAQFEGTLTGEAVARRVSQHATIVQTL